LSIIIDTNPVAWSELSSTLSLSQALSNIQIFINAHLAINPSNHVAVIASHIDCAEWLYPTPGPLPTAHTALANGKTREDAYSGQNGEVSPIPEDANKYRPFLQVETQLRQNLQALIRRTSVESLASQSDSTQIAGALTLALTYINKQTILASPSADNTDPTVHAAVQTETSTASSQGPLVSRVLILSVSPDLSAQYIPIMNAIFAAQRRHIPIDVLKLSGSTGFLQQASDATGGVYLDMSGGATAGLRARSEAMLQSLQLAYLPDATARRALITPGAEEVDFRAACFCHQHVVDLGFVCSVCLSIFCAPVPDGVCLTCGTRLELPPNVQPAVVPRRKKKKKRLGGVSGVSTPAEVGTPGPG